jgi:hypothetical protein
MERSPSPSPSLRSSTPRLPSCPSVAAALRAGARLDELAQVDKSLSAVGSRSGLSDEDQSDPRSQGPVESRSGGLAGPATTAEVLQSDGLDAPNQSQVVTQLALTETDLSVPRSPVARHRGRWDARASARPALARRRRRRQCETVARQKLL